ncbi:FecCD family ABC transporter permease [Acetobacter oeni]|uniref:Heme ABC transporter permease n=1 Tax=Acetobacter oeni TaxID=304077 RepID=A0A511XPD0_9PROT|nr:iron ABC transporter permease [Acetobacter oeni]MBB3884190.1 iron complex transport system permease protein [Acetobacter oeni]NHO20279.1 iron chelate uptake ABC transporter family permease subunit [Acetobacter oeni]GBR03659.1 ferrichrome Fe3+-siderophore transporter permease protein FecCD [Acetobacter oeni LMG 21952]GEN64797.1 heme ABC transporter permease [Acetobacter oeni]
MNIARPSPIGVMLGLVILLVTAVIASLMVGATGIGFHNLLHTTGSADEDMSWLIITQIRAPRVVLATLTGAALAVSGAVMQGLFRNPLADPGLIGVSSGAALGAASVIVMGGTALGSGLLSYWAVPAAGMAGGLASTTLLYIFATRNGLTSTTLVTLAGVALGAFASAITGILIFRANDTALRDLTFWTMGSLSGAAWSQILILAPFLLIAAFSMALISAPLNALLLGEDDARLMGYRVERVKRLAMFGVAVATGPVVAFVGVIGFIGVVVPHLVRIVTGPDHRILLPASALLGAVLLLIADTLARIIAIPADVPVGVVTAAIGAPVFVWLLARAHQIDVPS